MVWASPRALRDGQRVLGIARVRRAGGAAERVATRGGHRTREPGRYLRAGYGTAADLGALCRESAVDRSPRSVAELESWRGQQVGRDPPFYSFALHIRSAVTSTARLPCHPRSRTTLRTVSRGSAASRTGAGRISGTTPRTRASRR